MTQEGIIETTLKDGISKEKIAVIDLEGVIISDSSGVYNGDDMVQRVVKKLKKVQKDDSYKAVILRINTPGGTVFDSDKIANEVIKTKNKGKIVVALMEESATSGGYYVASAANKIIASEVTVTGSIGAVSQIIELGGLYEKLGVEVITITNTSGDVKTFENIGDPDSKDRKVYEQLLDDNFDAFVNMIDDNRELSREEILELADGSIYSGKRALELGLVDELGDMDDALDTASCEAALSNPKVIELADPQDFFSSLFGPSYIKSLKVIDNFNNKTNVEPGIYTWYIAVP